MAGKGEEDKKEEEEEEAAEATLLHHPSHPHPLFCGYSSYLSFPTSCKLCDRRHTIEKGYSCTTCDFYAHKKCVEAPPLIPRHHLHPFHPLSLSHDLQCVLIILTDLGDSSEKPIEIPSHDHPLTSLPDRLPFRFHSECTPCGHKRCIFTVNGHPVVFPGNAHPGCKFRIHKRCIQNLYYEDGSRVPRVCHQHELTTFSAKEGKPILICRNCGSDISSDEHIGCETCRVFYHRDCVKLFTETVQYPLHPDHDALVLFIHTDGKSIECHSCGFTVEAELCYYCTSCDFTLHARCGRQILLYHEEGRAMEIAPSWHEHPLILFYSNDVYWDMCTCCGMVLDGPAYRCTAKDCKLVLHEECTNQSAEINHPDHPEHPLVLLPGWEYPDCDACCGATFGLTFSCELCRFYLHISCASQFPTKKHCLHEHDLIRFEEIPSLKCNRCSTRTDSPLLRCVPCNFNLHEKCTELPGVVKHKTHHHPLTLRDSFMEDDTGEYYCDLCEQRRDARLGVYMCLQCKMEQPWVFHIECVLPELRGVNVKKVRDYDVMKESAKEVARLERQLLEKEKKVEETKQALEVARKRHAELCLLKAQGESFIL